MNDLHAIEALLRMAKESHEQAARRLAEAILHRDTSKNKLHMLQQYLNDYLKRHHQELKKVTTRPALEYSGAFIEKLQEAIKQQNEDCAFRERSLQICRQKLADCQKRIQSLEFYVQKQIRIHRKIENKKEQKLMDEYASSMARRIRLF
jgi:flagellar FliJ protein